MVETSETLLRRLREGATDDAWEDFYRLYWPAIVDYGRRVGLDHAQAKDVLQETMLTLMQLLPSFTYDRGKGRFRNFLFTIVHRKALGRLRRQHRRTRQAVQTAVADALYSPELPSTPDDDAERKWRESLLVAALRRLESDSRIEAETFSIFAACAIEGQPVAGVAKRFGVTENYVYQVKHRMTRRLTTEVRRLAELSGTPPVGL